MKTWLIERSKLFEMRDSLDAEIVPKGLLMMGIPGCGKSLSVKAIASQFNLPLYRVDMIEIFSGRHGKPEGAFVEACKMMEDVMALWRCCGSTKSKWALRPPIQALQREQGRIFAFFLTCGCKRRRAGFSWPPRPIALICCQRK